MERRVAAKLAAVVVVASAFPDRIDGNPNSTVVMMAEKAVDRIAANRSGCEKGKDPCAIP